MFEIPLTRYNARRSCSNCLFVIYGYHCSENWIEVFDGKSEKIRRYIKVEPGDYCEKHETKYDEPKNR